MGIDNRWCIDNSNFSIHASQECAQDNDNLTDISSFSHFNCSEIKLGSKWGKQEIENTGFVSNDLEASGLLASIMNSNGNFQDVIFCVGEAVETTLSNDGQPAFGVVKGIIKHKWNVE
ncbi:11970_t:CDS:2 [Gigaspora rosea]|nr:11970_t:CDS:2 [Gigaspora rosea]